MIEDVKVVGGIFFADVKSDERVTSELQHCLYCNVKTFDNKYNSYPRPLDYLIPLEVIGDGSIKRCPACHTIYLIKNPTENEAREA